ncbi:hypothetical protein OROMI_008852 [Orobanche minor]
MALLFELVSLAVKPLLLAKLSCQIGVRIITTIVLTWLEVLRFVLCLNSIVLWRLSMWAIAVLTLPARAFTALYRERLMEMHLDRLKNELDNILWDRKELEVKLHAAIKESKMMEAMLMELEEEHDEAIVKIEMLEGQVRDLKDEIRRLKEVHGKALSMYKSRGDVFESHDHMTPGHLGKSSFELEFNPSNKNIIKLSEDPHKNEINGPMKIGYGLSIEGDILARQRDIALSRSLFSAMLSLIVGFVVWEAGHPCMPLVVALFTVVIMSLTSVIQLFTKIERKPESDVVSLMSFNWFLLGTLTYPMLPRMVHFLANLTSSFMRRRFTQLGL